MRKGDKTLYSEDGRMTYGILYESSAAVETGRTSHGMREVMIKGYIKSEYISPSLASALREYEICTTKYAVPATRPLTTEGSVLSSGRV
ncbi:MAG: hypothetical protein LRY50_09635 [Geovibrio sp.]|nr:hypothetical protein [Geovibrio sp.]